MNSFISSCDFDEILYNIDVPGGLNSYTIGNPMYFSVNGYNISTSIPLVPEIIYSSNDAWQNWILWLNPLQILFSSIIYATNAISSIWDKEVRDDMSRIGWNPFNNNEELVLASDKVSFYKGMPVFRISEDSRSGSFYGIFLSRGE